MPAGEAFVKLADVLRAHGPGLTRVAGVPPSVESHAPSLQTAATTLSGSATVLAYAQPSPAHLPASALYVAASDPPMSDAALSHAEMSNLTTPVVARSDAATAEAAIFDPAVSQAAASHGVRFEVAGTAAMSEQSALLREVRLFRSALADALDELLAGLMRGLAADVLGRELQLAPADVASLVRRLIVERLAEEPVRLRVAPADADFACDFPVVADPRLNPGDAVLECRSGAIDARLGVRLADVLAAVTP